MFSFGAINENIKVKKITTKKGASSYTFSLKKLKKKSSQKESQDYYFDNLVISEGKEIKTLIFRYHPTREWLKSDRDFENFSGKITVFDIKGEVQNIITTNNGEQENIPGTNGKTVCLYELERVEIWCFGTLCTSVYYYSETCTSFDPSGGGGCKSEDCGPTDPESIPTIPTEGDPDWDTGAGGGSPSPAGEIVVKLINELEGKADCIYNILGGTAVGNLNIMHNTFLTFSDMQYNPADIIYKQEAGLVNDDGIQLNGRTRKVGDDYIVTLNSDRIINRSSIEVAKTILHESVHAILKRRYNVHQEGFIDSFKKYIESETGSNNITHAIMRDHYIEPMINNLKQFDNSRENDTFYRNLAWEGLHQFLTDAEKANILSTLVEARDRDGAMNCGEY